MQKTKWQFLHFHDLTNELLYSILKSRTEVFVLEQRCLFLDMDGIDIQSHHLMLFNEAKELLAYSRIVPPRIIFKEPSIGRVLTTNKGRGLGFGRALMKESLLQLQALYPTDSVRIAAQTYLQNFYSTFGFETDSEPYDEDGIPHVEMIRKVTAK